MKDISLPVSEIDDTIAYLTVPEIGREAIGPAMPLDGPFQPLYEALCPDLRIFNPTRETFDPMIAGSLDFTAVSGTEDTAQLVNRDTKIAGAQIYGPDGVPDKKILGGDLVRYIVRRVTTHGTPPRRQLNLPPTVTLVKSYTTSMSINGKTFVNPALYGYTKKQGYFPIRSRGATMGAVASRCLNNATVFRELRDNAKAMNTLVSFNFSLRYVWSIYMWEEGCRRLRLPCDQTAVLRAFRLRDVPAGKSRRAAIVNWVKAHARRRQGENEEAAVLVRRHFRGATEFSWNGFHVGVRPPQFEVEKMRAGPTAPPPKLEEIVADVERWETHNPDDSVGANAEGTSCEVDGSVKG